MRAPLLLELVISRPLLTLVEEVGHAELLPNMDPLPKSLSLVSVHWLALVLRILVDLLAVLVFTWPVWE